jgi:hypothetical protein
MFGDQTPSFTVTIADGKESARERGLEGVRCRPGFVVTDIPYVYLREMHDFCKEYGLSASVVMSDDDGVVESISFTDDVYAEQDPDVVPHGVYGEAERLATQLIDCAKGTRADLVPILTGILAVLEIPDKTSIVFTRTTHFAYIRVPVDQITSRQLETLFENPQVMRATIYPEMWQGVSIQLNVPADPSKKTHRGNVKSRSATPPRTSSQRRQVVDVAHPYARDRRYDDYRTTHEVGSISMVGRENEKTHV